MHTDKLLIRSILTGACAVGALAGCSSPPVPREQLAVGTASVEAAQSAGASELAPVELNQAREKLSLATAALRDKQLVAARRLAEAADADAQVARSKANAERSRRAADEVLAGLQTLRQQLDKTGNAKLMPTAPAAGNTGNSPDPTNPDMDPATPPNAQPGNPGIKR
jgi:hypothetical protein